ncbi:MAG: coproporphyrinogen dehydrogenase HemZ, partial [Oscillospiraceae bacterium]
MKMFFYNHDYRYAAEQILLTLFPNEHPEYPEEKTGGDGAELALFEGEKYNTAVCTLTQNGVKYKGFARA